jgi:hypothetical protein
MVVTFLARVLCLARLESRSLLASCAHGVSQVCRQVPAAKRVSVGLITLFYQPILLSDRAAPRASFQRLHSLVFTICSAEARSCSVKDKGGEQIQAAAAVKTGSFQVTFRLVGQANCFRVARKNEAARRRTLSPRSAAEATELAFSRWGGGYACAASVAAGRVK